MYTGSELKDLIYVCKGLAVCQWQHRSATRSSPHEPSFPLPTESLSPLPGWSIPIKTVGQRLRAANASIAAPGPFNLVRKSRKDNKTNSSRRNTDPITLAAKNAQQNVIEKHTETRSAISILRKRRQQ